MFIELEPVSNGGIDGYADALNEGLAAALDPIAEVLYEFVSQRFETQTDPHGAAWPALSERTLEARMRRGFAGTKILIVTAALRLSYQPRTQREQLRVAIGPSGPSVAYAATHQFGRGRIPPRPALPIGDAGPPPQALTDEIRATIADAVRASLLRWQSRSA